MPSAPSPLRKAVPGEGFGEARYLAPNSGLAYDSRYPHPAQRNVAVGMSFPVGTFVPETSDFSGSPSTQWLTATWGKERSRMKPRTISPRHFGQVNLSPLMSTSPCAWWYDPEHAAERES